MKLFAAPSKTKNYLLPLVVLVTVFLVSNGIGVPNFGSLQKPKFSALKLTKGSASAVVKTLTKSAHVKTTKAAPFSLVDNGFQIHAPVLPVSVLQQQSLRGTPAVTSVISARAPPA